MYKDQPGSRPSGPLRHAYRPDIDGLRAIAVLAVLFFHAGVGPFAGGFTGVDLFFVISGFLIGGHILTEEVSRTFRFVTFYQRRAKRILPALFAVLLTTLLLGLILLSPRELRHLATEAIATLLSLSNVYYRGAGGYFALSPERVPLLMTWSLGVEEQFYLFVPLLMIGVLRFRRSLTTTLLILSVASFSIACYQVRHMPDTAFYLLPGRAWELLAGVLLNMPRIAARHISLRYREALGVLGIVLILLPMFLLNASIPFPGVAALPSILGAMLVLRSEQSWMNRVILSCKPLTSVGRISYSLYLWHWPLLSLAAIVLGHPPSALFALSLLAIAFGLAAASYRWIEQPFRQSSLAPKPLLLRYAMVSVVFVGVLTVVRQTYGLRFLAPVLAAEDEHEADKGDPCQTTDPSTRPNLSSFCVERTGKPAIALWGDSHASTIAAEIRRKAHLSGYDMREMVKTACPPLKNTGRGFRALPDHGAQCIVFNNDVLSRLLNDPEVKIVVLAANWKGSFFEPYVDRTGWIVEGGETGSSIPLPESTARIFAASLEQTLAALQKAGKEVVVLQDVPSFTTDPSWQWDTGHQPVRRWLARHVEHQQPIDPVSVLPAHGKEDQEVRQIIRAVSSSRSASVFDPEEALCGTRGTYRIRNDQHFFFRDDQHLSSAGAELVLQRLSFPRAILNTGNRITRQGNE
ncbi:MAG: acyltransferase family protein [Janthinobacterium lividum]